MKLNWIWNPLFRMNIYWYKGDWEDFDKLMSKQGCNVGAIAADAGARTMEFLKDEQTIWAVWFRRDAELYEVVHECHHLAYFILSDRGLVLNEYTTEVFAYLEEYLVKEIWTNMNKRRKK